MRSNKSIFFMQVTATTAKSEDSLSEEAWLRGLKDKDEVVIRKIYQEHAPKVLARIAGMTGDLQFAEDCTQQVFLELIRTIHLFRGDSRLSTWIYGISTNVVYRAFQKKNRFASLIEALTLQQNAPEEPAIAEKLLLRKETRQLVWKTLEALSARKRIAILLCDIEGHTLEEAAAHLKIPSGTVSSRLSHARKEFRERFHRQLERQGLLAGDMFDES